MLSLLLNLLLPLDRSGVLVMDFRLLFVLRFTPRRRVADADGSDSEEAKAARPLKHLRRVPPKV